MKNEHIRINGFSLAEVLVSMGLMAGMALFLVRFLFAGVHINHISNDETHLYTSANDRLEQLKTMSFKNLGIPCLNSSTSCGSLTSNVTDTSLTPNVKYFDDSNPNYLTRWTVELPTGDSKIRKITVRVFSKKFTAIGNPRQVTLHYQRYKY